MTSPLHAPYYADEAFQLNTVITENVPLARDTFRVRFACPEIARRIVPGQFVMLRMAGCDDPLLGRPLAMYNTVPGEDGQPYALDVVYLVAGKFTKRLSRAQPGERLDVWGPLGNGFTPTEAKHLIMVAGGIGQTPFLALAAEALGRQQYGLPLRGAASPEKITFCYGARSADYFAGVRDFQQLRIDVRLSTDDGSLGHHGLVTDLLRGVLDEHASGSREIVCCGPERMMEAVAELARERGVPCQVSLETPMACGIGICFTCVAKVLQPDGGWDYKRTCVEGPVFDAQKIVW